MKKTLSIILTVCFIVLSFPVAVGANTYTNGDFEYTVNELAKEAEITAYKGKGGDIVIPQEIDGYTVTMVYTNTFSYTFEQDITSISLPDTVTLVNGGFSGVDTLKSLRLSKNLETLPDVSGCSSLESLHIPARMKDVKTSCLSHYSALKEITVSEWNEQYTSVDGILYTKDLEQLVFCPRGYDKKHLDVPEGVKRIGALNSYTSGGFRNCRNIESFSLPSTLERVATIQFMNTAFYNDTSNWENGVLYLDGWMIATDASFEEKYNNGEYTVKDGVVGIADGAFGNCTFEKLNLPEGLEVLNDFNVKPENASDVKLPSTLRVLCGEIFYKNTAITEISLPDGVEVIDCGFYGGMFSGCSNLSSISLPKSLKYIGEDTFTNSGITELVIPGSVENVNAENFGEMGNLKTLIFEEGITSITGLDLKQFPALERISFPKTLEEISISIDDSNYANNEANWVDGVLYIDEVLVKAKTDISGSYTIKNGTRIICTKAFEYCEELKNISIPSSVQSIGTWAFTRSGLTEVTVPGSIKEIPLYAFAGCQHLVSVSLSEGVQSIGASAFMECFALETVNIPDSVKSIDSIAFDGCNKLKIPELPKGISHIGYDVFERNLLKECGEVIDGCIYYGPYLLDVDTTVLPNVSSINIKEGTTLIAVKTLEYSDNITEITFPDSLEYICFRNFVCFNKIEEVTLPENLKYIGEQVFYGCAALKKVVIPDTVTYIAHSAFFDCNSLESITIPDSVMDIYWQDYENFYPSTDLIWYGNDVIVNGYTGSYAQKFAEEFGMNFKSIGDVVKDESTGITCAVDDGSPLKEAVFSVESTEISKGEVSYELSFEKDGMVVLPEKSVVVKIPISDDTDPDKYTLFAVSDSGEKTNVEFSIAGGYIIFKTDTLGEYTVFYNSVIYGDINGDEKVTAADALLVLQKAVGKITLDEALLEAADVDGKVGVTASDALLVLQRAVGKIPSFPVEN